MAVRLSNRSGRTAEPPDGDCLGNQTPQDRPQTLWLTTRQP